MTASNPGLTNRRLGNPDDTRLLLLNANDYDLLDSYSLDPRRKPEIYAQMLHELPAGLSEWAVHPGLDNAELLAIELDGNHIRQSDFDFWTSLQAAEMVKAEGIILIDYRALQAFWSRK
jgi:chitin disaccharide deacetylase